MVDTKKKSVPTITNVSKISIKDKSFEADLNLIIPVSDCSKRPSNSALLDPET